MAAFARFLVGAFIELCQLLLVMAASIFGTEIAIGRDLHDPVASDVPGTPSLGFVIIFAFYSLLVWLPARDLVEGWLGLVARRLPDRYRTRAENIGRGVMATVFAIVFVVLWLVLPADANTAQGQAFDRAYALLALSVFGLGSAVPRLWFGLRADAWEPPTVIPQLLAQAGKRGALFVIAVFLGIGFAFTAAYGIQVQRPDHVKPADDYVVVPAEDQITGSLCRSPTPSCPTSRHDAATRVHKANPALEAVKLEILFFGDPPVCEVSAEASWPIDDEARAWLAARSDDIRERVIAVPPKANVAVAVTLPDGADRCTYFIDITPAKVTP